MDSEDSVRFVKHIEPQTTTSISPQGLCVRKCGEGACIFNSWGKQICRCPFGKTGSYCQISEYMHRYTLFLTQNKNNTIKFIFYEVFEKLILQ